MLEIYRDHWWAEVNSDVDGIMATLTEDAVHYTFDGDDLMVRGPTLLEDVGKSRRAYARTAKAGIPIAGPFHDARWAFGDWGLVFEGVLTALYTGAMLPGSEAPLDPDQLYLVQLRAMTGHPMDLARRRMRGEIVYMGRPTHIAPVGRDHIRKLMG